MSYFITGTAGFIGFHLAKLLLDQGHTVHGYDGMTDYYDVRLKHARHALLRQSPQFTATDALCDTGCNAIPVESACARFRSHLHVRPHRSW